jgi:4-amino-4-deoxy-L-arabinose transferase-like glycosyltransferase/membrane-associated phospholipid phosphatase
MGADRSTGRSARLTGRLAAVLVALLFAGGFALLAHGAAGRDLLPGDQLIHDIVQNWRTPALDGPMHAMSTLGSGHLLIPLNIAAALVLWLRRYRYPLLVPALTLACAASEGVLKVLINRPRPKAFGYGFPSGHVMGAIVFFGLVVYLLWRARHGDAVARIAAGVGIVGIAAVGLSRVYVNAHWPSDIAGGAAAGLAFLILAIVRLGPQLEARDPEPGLPPLAAALLPRARAGWLLAGAVVALALFDVGFRTFTTNDEARFPVIAQYLLAGGNWLVPWLNGVPYVNKPPLMAWAIVAISWPYGHVTELTAVVPSVLAGLVTVFAVHRLGSELWNQTTGRYAAVIAATMQGLFFYARVPMPDMMLTAFISLAFWALHRLRRRPGRFTWLAFYGAVAAGFWTKGPAGLMPLAVALGWVLARRRVEPIGWLRLGRGLLTVGVLATPWVLVASALESSALQRTVAVDYLGWYLPQRPSIMTLLTPLRHLASVTFPWVWLLPFALYDAWRCRRGRGAERDAVVLVGVWLITIFALVAVSNQQRLRYYAPLVAPASLLLGWWLASTVVQRRTVSFWPLRWTAALAGTAVAIAVAWSIAQGRLGDAWASLPASTLQTFLVVAAGLTLVAAMEIGLRTQRLARSFPLAAVAAGVLIATLYHAAAIQLNRNADYRGLVRSIEHARVASEPVVALGVPVLPLAFYLDERIVELPEDTRTLPRAAVIVAEASLVQQLAQTMRVESRAGVGRHDIVVGRLTGGSEALPGVEQARARGPRGSARWQHVAFEAMCVIVALAATIARTAARRGGGRTRVVFASEAVMILALASFPANAYVFAGGVAIAAVWGFVRWWRPAFVDRLQLNDNVGLLLVLALPLDVLDDVLRGESPKADPVWLIAAGVGAIVITWARMRSRTSGA